MNMNQKHALVTKAASSIWGCIRQSVASRTREVILTLLTTGAATLGVLCPVLVSLVEMSLLGWTPGRISEVIKSLEYLPYEER